MKKLILLMVAVFSLSLVTTSCKESKKDSDKTEMHEDHEKHEEHAEEAHEEGADQKMAEAVYACPMDCEDGKTYAEAGTCPECKMDLKAKGEHKEMKHAEGCKCVEGGECKCEEGKCKCQTETASAKMDCTKCEPGTCECKA